MAMLLRLMAAAVGLAPPAAFAAEPESAGLPQLNAHSYPGQIFWLAVTFIVLYVFVARVALPRIGKTLAARSERIEGQIAEAGRLRDAAKEALADYEDARADSRARAQAEMNAALQKTNAEAAQREDALAKRLAEETRRAEQRLAAAKAEAMKNLGQVALEATRLATQRLIGQALSEADARRAVDAAMAERRS